MSAQPPPGRDGLAPDAPRLRSLLPTAEAAGAAEIVERFGMWQRAGISHGRPHVMLNMVSTADGRATVGGRSGAISGRADRELFHALRTAVDAVLVGAATARLERYGRLVTDPARRRLRGERGLAEEPLACIVSGRLDLGEDLPLLAEPDARVAVLTSSPASLPQTRAEVDYVRTQTDGVLDLAAALQELSSRFGIETILCEGGPHLSRQLLAAGLVDELFLSLAPKLAGGEPAGGGALRILAGAELEPPVELTLTGVLESDSYLFLRYGVSA